MNKPLLLILFLCCTISQSIAANTISQGQSIKDGETIISNGEKFVLGFFSPPNSRNRYVGIWYHNIPVQTVVWIANRETPVTDLSGVFRIGEDGNLLVLNGQSKEPLWSSNTSSLPLNTTAVLRDDGNFVLCSGSDELGSNCTGLWQSFHEPTDTYLPGMRIGRNRRTGEREQILTSWKTESDPSKGDFRLGLDETGLAQIVSWNQSRRHWRSGIWNNQVFVGVPNMRSALLIYGFSLSNDGNYFSYRTYSGSEIMRFKIRWDGKVEQLRWNGGKKNWDSSFSLPSNECDVYNKCGAYASCSNISMMPRCECVRGYEPRFRDRWGVGDWSGGCVRKVKLQCEMNGGERDGFVERDGVKLPDFSSFTAVGSREECEAECLKNCSCKAYAHGNGLGCLTWNSDLVDMEDFRGGEFKLYIRVANSELDKKKKSPKNAIIIAVVLGIFLLISSGYLLWRFLGKDKGLCKRGDREELVGDVSRSRDFGEEFSGQHDKGDDEERDAAPDLPMYSFQTIATATDNFSLANKLGQGGFGPVYKGKFPCGTEIAVKRLSRQSGQGLEEFENEVKLIARLQHRNLVRLLGCCIQGEEKMLIYEYLPNKSLDYFIFDPNNQLRLDWEKRFNVIEGIARGLLYLHRDSRLRVIHRDLKASNILLDEEMNPKISDFGMAKIFGGNQNQANTSRLVGTYGYMAPEYAMEGLFSVKSDVYSFGVLILEIVSGKRNTHYRDQDHRSIIGYAWNLWHEERAVDFVDPFISNSSCPMTEVLRCLHIALLCVQDSTIDRPTMASVVLMLASEAATLPMPREPTFTVGSSVGMDSFVETSEVMSNNDVTVTVVVGR
ncbi:hypothetical protein Scep_013220 [Stephania cephalantha]|uniref:Receptor-like serine/threonine-protein kinase n=1 Tax=Stephania cephalantha TaxID=152367 RepID=A0AAP0JH08_9MAGN